MPTPGELALSAQPHWYHLVRAVPLPVPELPAALQLHLVEYSDDDLQYPHVEPIGVAGGKAGNRRYLWRDAYWTEYDLNRRLVAAVPELQPYVGQVMVAATVPGRLVDGTRGVILARDPDQTP